LKDIKNNMVNVEMRKKPGWSTAQEIARVDASFLE
jgi:hypothetical protein